MNFSMWVQVLPSHYAQKGKRQLVCKRIRGENNMLCAFIDSEETSKGITKANRRKQREKETETE